MELKSTNLGEKYNRESMYETVRESFLDLKPVVVHGNECTSLIHVMLEDSARVYDKAERQLKENKLEEYKETRLIYKSMISRITKAFSEQEKAKSRFLNEGLTFMLDLMLDDNVEHLPELLNLMEREFYTDIINLQRVEEYKELKTAYEQYLDCKGENMV